MQRAVRKPVHGMLHVASAGGCISFASVWSLRRADVNAKTSLGFIPACDAMGGGHCSALYTAGHVAATVQLCREVRGGWVKRALLEPASAAESGFRGRSGRTSAAAVA